MKRNVLVVAACAAGIAMSACGGEKAIRSGETLVFMGDSITQYGKERTHGYPHLVIKGLKANGIDVTWHGVGICGNTSADMLKRFDADAMSKKPDVVTISAGVNDVWFPERGVTFEKFCRNEREMVAKVKAAGARAVLLSPTTALGEGPNENIRKFAGGVRQIAAEEGLAYAPTFEMIRSWIDDADTPDLTLMNGNGLKATYDSVHMVPAGDRQLARATLKAFGLDVDELSKAEAAWNSDDSLVPLVAPPSSSTRIQVRLTDDEAKSVSGLTLREILDRGIPSLAADPRLEKEGAGAATVMTVGPDTGTFTFKAYDQLLLAARALGIPVADVIKCAVLRGARDARGPVPTAPAGAVNEVYCCSDRVMFDATVKSVGATASACDVILKYGKDAKNLGKAARIVAGENGSFTYLLKGLKPGTDYAYELIFVNNADKPKKYTISGKFKTLAASDALLPSGEDDTALIQSAVDAAVGSKGRVTLSEGQFTVGAELMVTGGVSLVGQGYEKTVIRQTSGHRVVTLRDGSRLEGVTVTGGKTLANWESGAGVKVEDGTISHCRVWHNSAFSRNIYGGGVYIGKGTIDNSVIAFNEIRSSGYGAGIGWRYASGPVSIDRCLVYGNKVKDGNGGGISFNMGNPEVVISNTTIAGNSAGTAGGGLYLDQNMKKVRMVDSVVAGNTSESEVDVSGSLSEGSTGNLTGEAVKFVDAAKYDFRPASGPVSAGFYGSAPVPSP